ncbi:Probable lipoprotein precursor [Flavobacterium indicum GPTSA100-9 = DSM 17447]|uniref:Probable lipoprotein n=1 Tax=Flavobacterium indicum (strain DSM 17447 / CIP 109464 / GPTSA100-9) TaxID=1094466 RepID=H8XRL4_FLAIG|nr:DUF4292 domain-containing protein [Flavobacterium indicum]CCG54448.1 Probable lipoprotein precursor [Flavobacterium indicum GPTSA100-9 = DSM 17447]
MQNIFKYIVLLFVVASCKTKQVVVAEQAAKETDKSSEVIQKHYENKLVFQTASIRANANYEDSKQSLNINADLRIKKDEVIWISLKFLGITAAKAYITPSKVSYYEKINNSYFDGDYTMLSNWLGTDLDFQKVQNLLLGRPIDDLTKEEFIAEVAENLFQLKNKKNTQIEKIFAFETGNYLLKKQFINQIVKQRNVNVYYPSYQNQDNNFLPTGVNIVAKDKDEVKIDVEYKKITFNEDLNFPYSIPNGYKQIIID